MTIIGTLILTTAIGIGISRTPSSEEQDALKAVGKATYKQTNADQQLKTFEKKFIPKEVKEYAGWMTIATKVAIEKKISCEWTF